MEIYLSASLCARCLLLLLIQQCRNNIITLKEEIIFCFHLAVLRKALPKLLIASSKILHPELLLKLGTFSYQQFWVRLDPSPHRWTSPSLKRCDQWGFSLSLFSSCLLCLPSHSSSPTGLITHRHSLLSLPQGWQACTKREKSKLTNPGISTCRRNGSTLLTIVRDRCSIGRTSLSLIDTSVFCTRRRRRGRWNLFFLFKCPVL